MNRKLVRGGIFLFGGNALQALAALASNIALARMLGPDAFGEFAVAYASTGLILSVFTLRLNILIIRAPRRAFDEVRRELYFSALICEVALGIVLSIIWLRSIDVLSFWSMVLVATQFLLHWVNVNLAYFERDMPYARLAAVETTAGISGHASGVVLAWVGTGAAALYLREAITATLLTLCLALFGHLTILRWRWPRAEEWRALLKEARSVWLDGVLEGSFHRVTTLLAYAYAGAQSTGHFFVALTLAMRPNQLLAPITSRMAATWFMSKDTLASRQHGRDRLLILSALPLVAIAAAVVASADFIVPWVLGDSWAPTAPILVALSGVIIFHTHFEIMRAYSMVCGYTRLLLASRLWQATALGVLILAAGAGAAIAASELGLAVSAAFALAFASLFVMVRRTETRPLS